MVNDVLRNFDGDAGRHYENSCGETMVECEDDENDTQWSAMVCGVRVASAGSWDTRWTDTRVYTNIPILLSYLRSYHMLY